MQVQVNQLKNERVETKNHVSRLEDEVKSLRALLSHTINYNSNRTNPVIHAASATTFGNVERGFIRHQTPPNLRQSNSSSNSNGDRQKRHSLNLNYGTIHQDDGGSNGPIFHNEADILQPMQEQFEELLRNENGHSKSKLPNGHYSTTDGELTDMQLLQMEKDNLELRRELQDAIANRKHADNKIHA